MKKNDGLPYIVEVYGVKKYNLKLRWSIFRGPFPSKKEALKYCVNVKDETKIHTLNPPF